jgi:hypothetical protein
LLEFDFDMIQKNVTARFGYIQQAYGLRVERRQARCFFAQRGGLLCSGVE